MDELINDDLSGFSTTPSNRNNVAANISVLGPSFMFNINEKHSIGVLTRARMFNTFNNINGQLAEGLFDNFGEDDFSFNMNDLGATTHVWGEIGLAYGRVIFYDYDKHYVKAGITGKILLGGGIAQATSENLSGNFDPGSNLVALNGTLDYLLSAESTDIRDFASDLSLGLGADLGVIYELRTPTSRMADEEDNPRAINKYRLKVGLSVLDLGRITYDQRNLSRFDLNGSVNADALESDFQQALRNNFQEQEIPGEVRVSLPTSMNLNIDYKIIPKVFANLNVNQTLVKKDSPFNNNRLNQITFTPRFESRTFSVYLPIANSELAGTTIGAGLKIGPSIIGSSTVLSNLISEEARALNISFGFKIPVNHRR